MSQSLVIAAVLRYIVKKVSDFSSISLTKVSLAGNNLIIPGQEEFD
jgi:hypothetical protein